MPRTTRDTPASLRSDEYSAPEGGVPHVITGALMASRRTAPQARRVVAMIAGVVGFAMCAMLPEVPDAIDPQGQHFILGHEARLALGLFALAAVWWVFEVVPVGVTAILIGVVQAVFGIRDARVAFTDFMDPAVWFIIGALSIGAAFATSGLTNRIAYRMLSLVGERVSMIYLGSFVMTAGLTLVMAQSAVAPAVYPLLAVIHTIYAGDGQPTRFGKGLFIGMAYVAGAVFPLELADALADDLPGQFGDHLPGDLAPRSRRRSPRSRVSGCALASCIGGSVRCAAANGSPC